MPTAWLVTTTLFLNLFFVNLAFAQSPVTSQPAKNTIQYYCLQYKDVVGASEENCNNMFNGNNVKTAGGYVFLCNAGKIILDQLPAPVRFGAHFVPCTTDPMKQLNAGLQAVGNFLGINR